MNRRQRFALWVGVLVAVGMMVVPPWRSAAYSYTYDRVSLAAQGLVPERRTEPSAPIGYGLLFKPPSRAAQVDYVRLIIQVLVVGLLAGAVIATSSDSKR